jgi:hypothetical protein
VYDMYPWDRPASAAAPSSETAEGARAAVQVALDRRDNGGDAAATAVAAAHRPTAGATPQ